MQGDPVEDSSLTEADRQLLDGLLTAANSAGSKVLFGGRALPARLYHYTTVGAAAAILGSGRWFGTHKSSMNDRGETRTLPDLTRGLFRERIARVRVTQGQLWPRNPEDIKDIVTWHGLDVLPPRVATRRAAESPGDPYIFSFTEHDDDIQQWRSYAADGAGVCIWVDAVELARVSLSIRGWRRHGGALAPVAYAPETQGTLARAIVEPILASAGRLHPWQSEQDRLTHLIGQHSGTLEAVVAFYASFCKHRGFRSEGEWRVVIDGPAPDDLGEAGFDGTGVAFGRGLLGVGDRKPRAVLTAPRDLFLGVQPGPRCDPDALRAALDGALGPGEGRLLLQQRSTIGYVPVATGSA